MSTDWLPDWFWDDESRETLSPDPRDIALRGKIKAVNFGLPLGDWTLPKVNLGTASLSGGPVRPPSPAIGSFLFADLEQRTNEQAYEHSLRILKDRNP